MVKNSVVDLRWVFFNSYLVMVFVWWVGWVVRFIKVEVDGGGIGDVLKGDIVWVGVEFF